MSRTRKDRPYWVEQNQDAVKTDHDHTVLGKKSTRLEYVIGEDGDYLTEEVEETVRLYMEVSGTGARVPKKWTREKYVPYEPVYDEEGNCENYVPGFTIYYRDVVRTKVQYVLHRVEYKAYADYCTEGEKLPNPNTPQTQLMPCTPELPENGKYRYRDVLTKVDRRIIDSASRAKFRDEAQKYAKYYNSGEDLEDLDILTPLKNEERPIWFWN